MEQREKVLIVNLSSLHNLKPQFTVLNNLAQLGSDYPFNLPKLTKDFLAGNYQKIIDAYKTGEINTDQFITNLLTQSGLKTQNRNAVKTAWNTLIEFNEKPQVYCCGLWKNQAISTTQKFEQLLKYADQQKINEIYFISNTNPLNVQKIATHLQKKFPNNFISKKDIADAVANQRNEEIESDSENEDNSNNGQGDSKKPSLNIQISAHEAIPRIHLAVSYKYGAFKHNDTSTTFGLLKRLQTQLKEKEIVAIISQFNRDLEKASELKIKSIAATQFYEKKAPNKNDENRKFFKKNQ